jgi:hypothetical protein
MNIVLGGAFKQSLTIKNIKLYKSDGWNQCLVKVKSAVIKCIFMDEIKGERPYYIEMYRTSDLVTLFCDGMIVYQSSGWFNYSLEFIHTEFIQMDFNKPPIYEEIIKAI